MSTVLLEASGLAYRYPAGNWALIGVTLCIEAGDRLAVLGANGAGKSTLLLALAGLLPLGRGQLLWRGRLVQTAKSRSALRDQIGLLLQDPEDQLFAPTVEQDVAFGLVQRGASDGSALEQAHSVLRRLRISHLARRPVRQLSLGEKKRVALAGLLALRPALLLLDEPTAGLDCQGTQTLLPALDGLQADGVAVVLTTHDTNLAAQWATRVAILEGGRITAQGDKQRILPGRAVLEGAHLAPPLVYAAAAGLRELYPPSEAWPLPATLAELEQFIRRIAHSQRERTSGSQSSPCDIH